MKVFLIVALVAAANAIPEPIRLPLAALPEVAYENEAVNLVNSPKEPVEAVKFVDSPAEPARESVLVADLPVEQIAQEAVQVVDAPVHSFEPIRASELETLRVEGPIDLLAPINFDLERIEELLRSSSGINFVDIAPLLIPQDIQNQEAVKFVNSPEFENDAQVDTIQVVDAPVESQAEKVHFVDAPLEQFGEKVIVVDGPLEPISRSELETIRLEELNVQPSDTVIVVDEALPVNFPHRYPVKHYDDPLLR